MYSPRIAEDLIPLLYRAAKAKRVPMTVLVSEMLRKALTNEKRRIANDEKKDIEQESVLQERRIE